MNRHPFFSYLLVLLSLTNIYISFISSDAWGFRVAAVISIFAAYFLFQYHHIYYKYQVITDALKSYNESHLIIIKDSKVIHSEFGKYNSKDLDRVLSQKLNSSGLLEPADLEQMIDAIAVKSNWSVIKISGDCLCEIKARYINSNIIITISTNVQERIVEFFTSLNIMGFVCKRSEIIASNLTSAQIENIIQSTNNLSDESFFLTPTHNVISDNIHGNNDYTLGAIVSNKQNYENLWKFLQTSSLSSAILDQDFKIVLANRHFTNMIGASEVNNKSFFDFIDKEDEEAVKNLAHGRLGSNLSAYIELEINNKQTAVHLHINYICADDRKYFVFSIIDTTKYKTMEMNFIHSQKMQAIGQLSGAIAHDFNNLLTGMIGFCDLLLQRHPVGDRSFGDLMQIKQTANRAANLVRQLLAFSRKQVLQPKVIDISSVLSDLSHLIRRLIWENINFDIHYGQDLDFVKVDQGQIEQVIINLVVNARDAMHLQSGGKLYISTSNVIVDAAFDESEYYAPPGDEQILFGNYVTIEISDTGPGIPTDVLDKIFSPFFSTKAPGSGTGLGLSTVYGIVTQTKGYIRLKTSDAGTSFFIFLKSYYLKENEVFLETKESFDEDEKLPNRNITDCGKILIVEDEAPVRTFSSQALMNKGYSVLQADCPDTALKILDAEKDSIELIISDIMMPGMTGPQMIQEVYKKYPNVKVVFVSGYAEDALSDYNFPNAHFLAKPYSLKQLTAKVQELMLG
jgi:PAS domain S-box-containing protein